jgi:hypothetical protein
MVKSGTVYSGRKYLDNINIIYKSFNIDMSGLPVVRSQSKKKIMSANIPIQEKIKNHEENDRLLFLREFFGRQREKFDSILI